MIAHVVLFQPRPDLSEHERQELSDALSEAVRLIPSVRRARVGARVTHGRGYETSMSIDYSYAAVIEFDDVPGLRAYLDHEAHERLAARFFGAAERVLIYDFELQET